MSCLEPADITQRRFSRGIFGVSSGEVKKFLAETAAEFGRLTTERFRLKTAFDRTKTELVQVAVERDVLQSRLKRLTADLETAREQATAGGDKVVVYQVQESLLAQVVAERDSLQGKVKELASELETLRAAAQDYAATFQEQKRLLAQVVGERDSIQEKLAKVTTELKALQGQVIPHEGRSSGHSVSPKFPFVLEIKPKRVG